MDTQRRLWDAPIAPQAESPRELPLGEKREAGNAARWIQERMFLLQGVRKRIYIFFVEYSTGSNLHITDYLICALVAARLPEGDIYGYIALQG